MGMIIFGRRYTVGQVRKFLVSLVGAVIAIAAHYDIAISDQLGDVILIFDLIFTPVGVAAVPNEPAP